MIPVLLDPRTRAAYAEGAGVHRIVPDAVAIPRSVEDVVDLVRDAGRTGQPIVPRGSGSGMGGGNVGRGTIVDLSLGFTDLQIDGADRTALTGASVTWGQLTEAARTYGLRLPPDPASGAFATLGGMVSTNAAGPRSVKYGSVRPWVEALQVVGADGGVRWVRRGDRGHARFTLSSEEAGVVQRHFPHTRKNSSGYALDAFGRSGDEADLFIGAEGTLGLVTAIRWRLDPTPTAAAGVALAFGGLAEIADAVPFLLSLDPSAIELLDRTLLAYAAQGGAGAAPGTEALLLVEFEREVPAAAQGVAGDAVRGLKHLILDAQTAVDRRELDQLWAIRRAASPVLARLPDTQRSVQVIEDGCVPLGNLAEYIRGLREISRDRSIPLVIFGHAGDGHVHVNALPDLTRADWRAALTGLYCDATDLLLRLGGTPSGEHGDGRLRAGVLPRVFGAPVMALFERLKHAYDPLAILNPGVILPAAGWDPLAELKVGPDAAPIPADVAAGLRALERSGGWLTPKTELAR